MREREGEKIKRRRRKWNRLKVINTISNTEGYDNFWKIIFLIRVRSSAEYELNVKQISSPKPTSTDFIDNFRCALFLTPSILGELAEELLRLRPKEGYTRIEGEIIIRKKLNVKVSHLSFP